MISLLDLSLSALAGALASGIVPVSAVDMLPEEELAAQLWCILFREYRRQTPAGHLPVIEAFAGRWWQLERIKLRYGSSIAGLGHLPVFAARLRHLELDVPTLTTLASAAPLAACTALTCLSLRGCVGLSDDGLAAVSSLVSLRALDLSNLGQLKDAVMVHVAKLPCLQALNLSGTFVGDAALDMLTYGRRLLMGWGAAAGTAPAAACQLAAWPPLPLQRLELMRTRITRAGVQLLANLNRLVLLDVRCTNVSRAALLPLAQRFTLQLVQNGVLAATNAVAAAAINHQAVACACDAQAPAVWVQQGAQVLLHASPAGGTGALELRSSSVSS